MISNKITIYSSVSTVLACFIDTLRGEEKFPELRLIKMMGEAVYKKHVDLYKKHFSDDCIFVNRLGSTETGSIRWFFIDKDTSVTDTNVPVGYPVADNEILLLDEDGAEVAPGRIGEISVKSKYLTPGYWRRPDLTEAAFFRNPEDDGKRTYRTGDLGRMLPDGCLVDLGRKDFQVKIRGHRIEVAEIEMALLEHSAIKEAVVWSREDQPGDKRLAAYLVPAAREVPTVNRLRKFLADSLPDYMIPQTYVTLDALPLAPNGKVDRRALPAPDTTRPNLETEYASPCGPLEKLLVGILRETVALERIGVHDNFFELGGNSLGATKIIGIIRSYFQIQLKLREFLRRPTVNFLANSVSDLCGGRQRANEIAQTIIEVFQMPDENVEKDLGASI
jgi:acyl-coenzyme A synthetase/AMP-(fatty) acid ligase/acyl carrier protein